MVRTPADEQPCQHGQVQGVTSVDWLAPKQSRAVAETFDRRRSGKKSRPRLTRGSHDGEHLSRPDETRDILEDGLASARHAQTPEGQFHGSSLGLRPRRRGRHAAAAAGTLGETAAGARGTLQPAHIQEERKKMETGSEEKASFAASLRASAGKTYASPTSFAISLQRLKKKSLLVALQNHVVAAMA